MIESEFFCNSKPQTQTQTPYQGYEKNHASSVQDESFNKQQVSKSTGDNLNFLEEKSVNPLHNLSSEVEFHDSFAQNQQKFAQKCPKKKLFKKNVIDDFSDKEEWAAGGPKGGMGQIFDMQESPVGADKR
jgi:hypothetical protein